MFRASNCSSSGEFCTSSVRYFTIHLKRRLVADTIRMIYIVSATRFLLKCMIKYCKLLAQDSPDDEQLLARNMSRII